MADVVGCCWLPGLAGPGGLQRGYARILGGTMITFQVPGLPAPQGSKRHVGRGVMVESSKRLKPWRNDVACAALKARQSFEAALLEGPAHVRVRFVLPRPKSHRRASGELKPNAPRYPSSKPDVDKLLRAILDALTGVLWRDDSQVAVVEAVKDYGTGDEAPGAHVSVSALT
jgi:crossover junction endodeoxyribonuclease RusA